MLKYYLTGLASSLLLLAAGSLAHQLSTGILLFALVSAAFCIFQISNLPFTQSAETLNEQQNSIKTVNDNNFNLLENRSNLFIEGHLHRLGYLLHLARPEKKSEFEIIYALNCLLETISNKTLLFFERNENDLAYLTGIRSGQRRHIEIIKPIDTLVEEIFTRIKSLSELKSILNGGLNDRILRTGNNSGEPETCFMPISFFGDFLGLLVIISNDEKCFSPAELITINFFSEHFALFLQNRQIFARKSQEQIGVSENWLCKKLLERILPDSVPIVKGWDLSFNCQTTPEYGGDYFDFIITPGGSTIAVVGKASGKGIDAALFFTRLQALSRSLALQMRTPGDLLNAIALHLGNDANEALFSSLLVLYFKPGSAEVTFANAGHTSPIINRTRSGYAEIAQGESGVPLGLFGNSPTPYQNQTIQMLPGDGLFIYTDGVLENARNAKNEISTDQIKLVLEKLSEQTAAEMLEYLLGEIHISSQGNSCLSDDQTSIYLKVE
jgi:serine phosphatase RsbU (regulator of sigma subunit)